MGPLIVAEYDEEISCKEAPPDDYKGQHLASQVLTHHCLENMAKKQKDDVQSAANYGIKSLHPACAKRAVTTMARQF